MKRIGFVVVAVLALGLAGAADAKKAVDGMPAFKAGDPEAIWIWHDATGWHLRAATGKQQHAFQGIIRPVAGEVGKVKATRTVLTPKIDGANGKSSHFDFDLLGGVDGFDWDAADPCMTLELRIDKRPQEAKVHVGAKAESPSAMPFDACKS